VSVRADPLPIVGVELGSRMENTALSVTERAYVPTGEVFTMVHRHHPSFNSAFATTRDFTGARPRFEAREKVTAQYRVRHLERRKPPVLYRGVAERTAQLVKAVGKCVVAVDITRTGRPVYGLVMKAIRDALEGTDIRVTPSPVTVTGIAGGVSHGPDAGWLVPRRDLVSAALLLFEADQLKIAEGLELASTLTEEFVNFKLKEDPKADLEGWRLAKNDDLVLAVAMSVWAAERFLRKEESVPAGSLGIPRAAG
jgi:hypothetical protein